MQRALFGRSASLAQLAAAALDGPLAARSAPLLQRLERSMSSVSIPPPECLLRPLEVPLRYLFGPGPSNVPPRVLAAGSKPIIGHLHPEMYEVTVLKISRIELSLIWYIASKRVSFRYPFGLWRCSSIVLFFESSLIQFCYLERGWRLRPSFDYLH